MEGEERRGRPEAIATFRRRLSELKRNGSNVLLVGTDPLDPACERLLGNSAAGRRYRLFVTTDAGPTSASEKLRAVRAREPDEASVVNWRVGGWDEQPSEPGESPDSTLRVNTVESDDLEALANAVESAVERFETEAGGLSPAELRVCFDSVTPLLGDYGERDVRRLLLDLTETVERVDGMAHYHLCADPDSETVASLAPTFDAVIDIRHAEGDVEQRWHLDGQEVTTSWLPL